MAYANDWEGLWCILEPATRGGKIERDRLSVFDFFINVTMFIFLSNVFGNCLRHL